MLSAVVVISAGFVGTAAAADPKQTLETPDDNVDRFDDLSNQFRYIGQSYNVSFDPTGIEDWSGARQIYLAEAEVDSQGDVVGLGTVIPYSNTSNSDAMVAEIDFSDLTKPGTYVISNTSSNPQNGGVSDTFSVQKQDLTIKFTDSKISESEKTSLEIASTNRPQVTDFNVLVRAVGPDGPLTNESVEELFEARDGSTGNTANSGMNPAVTEDISQSPANLLSKYNIENDEYTDLTADGWTLLNLNGDNAFSGDASGPLVDSDDELTVNATNLKRGEGLPGDAEYTLEFVVADTGVTETDTLSIDSDKTIPPVYNLQIPNDGGSYTVGFPAPLNETLDEALSQSTQDIGTQTTVYVYKDGGWVSKQTANIKPEALDAVVIVTDGDDGEDTINLEMEFETTSTPNPGDVVVSEGWNYVSAPSYAPADRVFNVGKAREVFYPFTGPSSDDVRSAENFLNYRIGSTSTREVSPFNGYFVYVEEEDAIQTGLAGGVVDLPQSNEYLNTSCC